MTVFRKYPWLFAIFLIIIAGLFLSSYIIKTAQKNLLLSPEVYYELPTGGYIYIEDEYIRHNKNSFNGTLDYQITLNYSFIEEK